MFGTPGVDFFELFGMMPTFSVDQEQLSMRYRELQRAAHPDRFANASAQDKRISVQQAALINEAYQVLRSPLSRARYMLERLGATIDDTDTRMDPAFLMEQMMLREALAEVSGSEDPFFALDKLRDRIETMERDMVSRLAQLLDGDTDQETLALGVQLIRKMQFTQRLLGELDDLEDTLVHAS